MKCLIPKCDVLFLTDGPMKQHLTKAHKMNKKEIAKLMLGVSVSKKSEKGTIKEKELLKNSKGRYEFSAYFVCYSYCLLATYGVGNWVFGEVVLHL